MVPFLRRRTKSKSSPPIFIPKRIIVHHSLTTDSGTVSWGAIRKYHMKTLNWSDIGYHCGVELVKSGNEIYHEIPMGRMWDKRGAHAKGYNSNSLGICFTGNYDVIKPSKQAYQTGAKLIALWLKLYGLSVEDVFPHSYFSKKTCPGSLFDMDYLKLRVQDKGG